MNKLSKIIVAGLLLLFLLVSTLQFSLALVVDSVITDSSGISPGQTTEIELGLKNNGETTIQDVSVSLDLKDVPFAPADASSEFSVDEIREDKIKYARFSLIVLNNAQPDIYKIPITITYHEEDAPEIITKASLISVTVVADPILSVNSQDSVLIKGQNNELTVKLVNQGVADIKFLEMEVTPSLYVTLLSSNKIYIGDLDSDDFDSVTFNIFVKENAPDSISVPVTINYKDSLNKAYTKQFDVPVKAYTEDKAVELGLKEKSYTMQIVIIVILLIVFYLLYRYVRKSLRKKNLQEM
ncbi:MAG: hypothetical protein RL557_374 [archaeon]